MARILDLFALFLCIFVSQIFAAQHPETRVSRFHNLPARLHYFDDTTVVLYWDAIARDVYISNDEGKHWKRLEDIPVGDAALLVSHPFDNRMAFVFGRKNEHYRTIDRGKTWQTFKTPIQPSLLRPPLVFHAKKENYAHIIFQGSKCDGDWPWGSSKCHEETYVTEDAFGSEPRKLMSQVSQCLWAHSSKQFDHKRSDKLIFCVAFDTKKNTHSLRHSRLYASEDYFENQKELIDFGDVAHSRGVVSVGVVNKFFVAALKDLHSSSGEMMLYVSIDGNEWSKAHFPHASSSKLHESAYTIVESTTHSLAVDVQLHSGSSVGTLFVSNSNGTYFVESLRNTNRNAVGYVDFEDVVGVEGVGLANVVANADEVDGSAKFKEIRSVITFDDGSHWSPIRAPAKDLSDHSIGCDPSHPDTCSLHLYSVTTPHNFGRVFSSTAPGFVMGVGSVGKHLKPYTDCDTFLSTDAGVNWKMVSRNANLYEFGDQGSVIVIVDDEEITNKIKYSTDAGTTWEELKLDVHIRARLLTTIPDSTSLKFILLGTTSRQDQSPEGKHVVIFIDFDTLGKRKCAEADFEKWYARSGKDKECLMGHKQWYKRRKPDADCVVHEKFADPVEHEDNCLCTEEDYECDYNFVLQNKECTAAGPEPVPAGVCISGKDDEKYMGSSGYRLIPGNTCRKEGGVRKDEKVEKSCSKAQVPEGHVTHQTFEFPDSIAANFYFRESTTILVQLANGAIWQSSNEGYSWKQLHAGQSFIGIFLHPYSNDRAYLLTDTSKIYYTIDTGKSWHEMHAPHSPNLLGASILHFHPEESDWIIWSGAENCSGNHDSNSPCKTIASYTTDHGRNWHQLEQYVRNCAWARDKKLRVDTREILCESYRDKKGSQMMFGANNPLELVSFTEFFKKRRRIFEHVVGFAKFAEYLLVAELKDRTGSLDLQVSLDGTNFATGSFPPNMRLNNHAYTVLESSTDAVFLHLTMSERHGAEWGSLLKSNSNGTYYGVSLEYVNRNPQGYVDFEKMIGLEGIALMNIVSNPEQAGLNGKKQLQTRITHNDGGTWKPLTPPAKDSLGQPYRCKGTKCALHIHGYTERPDTRATYSSPSAVGLMIAVGNVGEHLASYTESDTFFTRDGGFTWEEIHKDAHLYEFGDSGSVLVLVNDEKETDHVLYSLNEGLTWKEYKFGKRMRVRSIVTVQEDTSRKFLLLGYFGRSPKAVAVHLDFSSVTHRTCNLNTNNPDDDFELWSPSEEREERCLFGRQVLYHRRKRESNCVVGKQTKESAKVVKNCECIASDFECEFNYVRVASGECVLSEGATPLPTDDEVCWANADVYYERTAYRKIPRSTCEGGKRLDHGTMHNCPGLKGHGVFFWFMVALLPIGFAVLMSYWYQKKGYRRQGPIRLGDSGRFDDSGPLATLASVPWFILGVVGIVYAQVASWRIWDSLPGPLRRQRGYRVVPVDEDAQVLRFEDEE